MNTPAVRFTWFFALTQLRLKYRYTSLGFAWNFLEPALFLGVLSLVFSVVNRMDIGDYAVYLFGALIPWRYFEKSVNTGMESIVGADWALKKMPVSAFVFPLTRWIIATLEFFVSLTVVFVVFVFIKDSWSVHLVIIPFAIIPWAAFALGAAMTCAVLFTFFRDIRPIVQMFLMLAFFSAPILFSRSMFAEGSVQAMALDWHPLTYFAALFQKPIYYGIWPSAVDWSVTGTIGVAVFSIGWSLVDKYKGRFYYYL
jgi:lipopolysaccharide transport system permease protein